MPTKHQIPKCSGHRNKIPQLQSLNLLHLFITVSSAKKSTAATNHNHFRHHFTPLLTILLMIASHSVVPATVAAEATTTDTTANNLNSFAAIPPRWWSFPATVELLGVVPNRTTTTRPAPTTSSAAAHSQWLPTAIKFAHWRQLDLIANLSILHHLMVDADNVVSTSTGGDAQLLSKWCQMNTTANNNMDGDHVIPPKHISEKEAGRLARRFVQDELGPYMLVPMLSLIGVQPPLPTSSVGSSANEFIMNQLRRHWFCQDELHEIETWLQPTTLTTSDDYGSSASFSQKKNSKFATWMTTSTASQTLKKDSVFFSNIPTNGSQVVKPLVSILTKLNHLTFNASATAADWRAATYCTTASLTFSTFAATVAPLSALYDHVDASLSNVTVNSSSSTDDTNSDDAAVLLDTIPHAALQEFLENFQQVNAVLQAIATLIEHGAAFPNKTATETTSAAVSSDDSSTTSLSPQTPPIFAQSVACYQDYLHRVSKAFGATYNEDAASTVLDAMPCDDLAAQTGDVILYFKRPEQEDVGEGSGSSSPSSSSTWWHDVHYPNASIFNTKAIYSRTAIWTSSASTNMTVPVWVETVQLPSNETIRLVALDGYNATEALFESARRNGMVGLLRPSEMVPATTPPINDDISNYSCPITTFVAVNTSLPGFGNFYCSNCSDFASRALPSFCPGDGIRHLCAAIPVDYTNDGEPGTRYLLPEEVDIQFFPEGASVATARCPFICTNSSLYRTQTQLCSLIPVGMRPSSTGAFDVEACPTARFSFGANDTDEENDSSVILSHIFSSPFAHYFHEEFAGTTSGNCAVRLNFATVLREVEDPPAAASSTKQESIESENAPLSESPSVSADVLKRLSFCDQNEDAEATTAKGKVWLKFSLRFYDGVTRLIDELQLLEDFAVNVTYNGTKAATTTTGDDTEGGSGVFELKDNGVRGFHLLGLHGRWFVFLTARMSADGSQVELGLLWDSGSSLTQSTANNTNGARMRQSDVLAVLPLSSGTLQGNSTAKLGVALDLASQELAFYNFHSDGSETTSGTQIGPVVGLPVAHWCSASSTSTPIPPHAVLGDMFLDYDASGYQLWGRSAQPYYPFGIGVFSNTSGNTVNSPKSPFKIGSLSTPMLHDGHLGDTEQVAGPLPMFNGFEVTFAPHDLGEDGTALPLWKSPLPLAVSLSDATQRLQPPPFVQYLSTSDATIETLSARLHVAAGKLCGLFAPPATSTRPLPDPTSTGDSTPTTAPITETDAPQNGTGGATSTPESPPPTQTASQDPSGGNPTDSTTLNGTLSPFPTSAVPSTPTPPGNSDSPNNSNATRNGGSNETVSEDSVSEVVAVVEHPGMIAGASLVCLIAAGLLIGRCSNVALFQKQGKKNKKGRAKKKRSGGCGSETSSCDDVGTDDDENHRHSVIDIGTSCEDDDSSGDESGSEMGSDDCTPVKKQRKHNASNDSTLSVYQQPLPLPLPPAYMINHRDGNQPSSSVFRDPYGTPVPQLMPPSEMAAEYPPLATPPSAFDRNEQPPAATAQTPTLRPPGSAINPIAASTVSVGQRHSHNLHEELMLGSSESNEDEESEDDDDCSAVQEPFHTTPRCPTQRGADEMLQSVLSSRNPAASAGGLNTSTNSVRHPQKFDSSLNNSSYIQEMPPLAASTPRCSAAKRRSSFVVDATPPSEVDSSSIAKSMLQDTPPEPLESSDPYVATSTSLPPQNHHHHHHHHPTPRRSRAASLNNSNASVFLDTSATRSMQGDDPATAAQTAVETLPTEPFAPEPSPAPVQQRGESFITPSKKKKRRGRTPSVDGRISGTKKESGTKQQRSSSARPQLDTSDGTGMNISKNLLDNSGVAAVDSSFVVEMNTPLKPPQSTTTANNSFVMDPSLSPPSTLQADRRSQLASKRRRRSNRQTDDDPQHQQQREHNGGSNPIHSSSMMATAHEGVFNQPTDKPSHSARGRRGRSQHRRSAAPQHGSATTGGESANNLVPSTPVDRRGMRLFSIDSDID